MAFCFAFRYSYLSAYAMIVSPIGQLKSASAAIGCRERLRAALLGRFLQEVRQLQLGQEGGARYQLQKFKGNVTPQLIL